MSIKPIKYQLAITKKSARVRIVPLPEEVLQCRSAAVLHRRNRDPLQRQQKVEQDGREEIRLLKLIHFSPQNKVLAGKAEGFKLGLQNSDSRYFFKKLLIQIRGTSATCTAEAVHTR